MERWRKEIGRKTRGGRGKKAGEVAEAIRWQTKLAKRPGTGCFQLHYRTVINWCPRCSIVSEGRLGSAGSRGVPFFAARQNHTVRALSLSLPFSVPFSATLRAPARHVRAGSWIFFPLCSGDAMSINSQWMVEYTSEEGCSGSWSSVLEFLSDENPIFIAVLILWVVDWIFTGVYVTFIIYSVLFNDYDFNFEMRVIKW